MKSRLLAVAIAALVGACSTIGPMEIPKITSAKLIKINKPVARQPSFALAQVIANIKRGTTFLHFPASGVKGVKGTLCNHRYTDGDAQEDWSTGTSALGDWSSELGEIFYEALNAKGLNVAGDPKDIFRRQETADSAEYLVGARIAEIRGNFCDTHHWYDGRPLNKTSGELFIDVEWTILSRITQREILTTSTQGYYKQIKPRKSGVQLTFHEAFAVASENLLASRKFVDIALGKRFEEVTPNKGPTRVFLTRPQSKRNMARRIDAILPAVVTVRLGRSHGSGFVISEDGLILTNQHVVGAAKNVTIVFSNGVEVAAKVLARHEVRDVALIKMPIRVPSYLPLRIEEPNLLEKVFVIGTPLHAGLRSTVTSGIVSAIRVFAQTGIRLIQSDAAISPGNSGGPLFDENGNVIGISVSSAAHDSAQNLNNFIPIGEALEALNLKPKIVRD